MNNVTLVITSCGRMDLLDKTISSLQATDWNDFAFKILIEDSGDKEIWNYLDKTYINTFDLIIKNEKNLGKHASIDTAYSHVKTKYIFHCEDDWWFFRPGYVKDSLRILERYAWVSMVSLRSTYWDMHKNGYQLSADTRHVVDDKIAFYTMKDKSEKNPMHGYSLNPGLRRLGDVKEMGSHVLLGGEYKFSAWFLSHGKQMVFLENSAVDHIGWGRGLSDPNQGKSIFIKNVKNLIKAILNIFGAHYILHN